MKLIKKKNGDFKIEKINFRRSYIEKLTKFFKVEFLMFMPH